MTKTSADLVKRALQKLKVVGAGQAPTPEDAQLVTAEIEPLMADLATRGIYNWGDPDAIDEDAFLHLAALLANSVADDFGQPEDEGARRAAENRLKLLQPQILSGQTLQTEYF